MSRATSHLSRFPIVLAMAACAHPAVAPAPSPAPSSSPTSAAPATTQSPTPIAAAAAATAQPPPVLGYDKPPQQVLDVLHAPSPPQPLVNPTRDTILLVSWVEYPPISQVAEPILRLAGVRVEPRTRRQHDTPGGYGIAPCARSLALVDVATSRETPVALPPGGCADDIVWAADGKRFAFRNTSSDAVELWIGNPGDGTTRRLGNSRLNPMLGSSLQWLADQKTLLVKLVPANAGPRPQAAAVAEEAPSTQETDGQSGESSTYEARDTLKDKHDEALFEFYATSQLALVDAATGATTALGAPGVYTAVTGAPDGDHILVTEIKKPYSYLVAWTRFAHSVSVWDRSGRAVSLAQLPVADRVPVRGVPTGPRDFEWRATEPAALIWAEALDGGDWNTKVPARDKVLMQSAPFTSPAVEIARTEQRFIGIDWAERRNSALLYEFDSNRHWQRTFVVDIDARSKPSLLWDMSSDEHYKDPGNPVHRVLRNGRSVVRQDGDAIFLSGEGASPEGERPFLDRLDLKTRKSERLFRSAHIGIEAFLAFADDASRSFLTWHQSPMDPPNAMLRTLSDRPTGAPSQPGEAILASTSHPVTHLVDPTPQVRAIKKKLVKYKRKDGLELSFTLYTPPDYQDGTRVPAILYAYPLDYASASTAGQVTDSDQRFTVVRNYRLLLLSGYAIIDGASFPVIGDPKKAYDTYLEQLVDDARAAVDKAVELGVVDRDRIGVTGHSHGAMMTANLVAHTDLFRAGVATSGAYNKTLTPFGFQSERRSVWKARDVYMKVSPFFSADKMRAPLLLIHGADDANPGTTPIQSQAFYQAIRGNGGISRLVMLPHEPHWYAAMESNEQLAYEELRWFDKYVKNAPPRSGSAPDAKTAAKR